MSDKGPGIDARDLQHIFERFYRSTNAVKQTKGAGLGLYLARAIVEAHGGRMWADPKVKSGARILSYSVVGRQCHIEEGATLDGAILWANVRVGREALVRESILGRQSHIGRSAIVDGQAVLGDKSVVTDYSTV